MKKLALLCCLLVSTSVWAATPAYHVVKTLKLGGDGFWDYLSVDSGARRLYVSRWTHVMVVDLDTDKLVGDIPNTEGVHGIALAPDLGRGFISCGRTNEALIFNLKTLKVIGKVVTGAGPDAILYDPASKRVFTMNGHGHSATAFDAATGKIAGTIDLGGKPEEARADGKGKIYINIEDKSQVAELDSHKLTILKRFSLAPGEEPSGMGLDVAHHLVFSGCHNQMMTVLDPVAGKVIATVPIGRGVDGAAYDPGAGLAFASNGEGTLTVVRETSPGKFAAENVPTVRSARTMALDPKTHDIYLSAAKFEPMPRAKASERRQRPKMVKGSFMIVVVGRE